MVREHTEQENWATGGDLGVTSNRDIPVAFPEVAAACRRLSTGAGGIDELWDCLNRDGLFFVRPDYYGLPLHVAVGGEVAALAFTSLALLAEAAGECSWVCLSGDQVAALAFRPRWVVIDPGTDSEVQVRLPALPAPGPDGQDPGTAPYVVDIHRAADGTVRARTWLTGDRDAEVNLP